MGEVIFIGIVAAVAVIMFVISYSFKEILIDTSGGPGLFPRIVVILLLVLLTIRLIQILITKKDERKKFVFTEMFKGASLVYLLATFAYFLLCKPVGFLLTTIVYLIGMMLYCGYKQSDEKPTIKRCVVISLIVIVSVVIFDYVFCELLNVLLPKGILGF